MRVAGVDCGTNSIRLLIADVELAGGARVVDIVRRMDIVRLGQGVDKTGMFAPEALARTLERVTEYAQICRDENVESVRFAATSATRDASNRAEFIEGVRRQFGIDPQVLTGEEEARTSFEGAVGTLPGALAEPLLVVDLGGGSTELVLGSANGGVLASTSMNVGSVRMRERHLASDPAKPEEVAAARRDVQRAIEESGVDLSQTRTLVGLAGTVTSVTAAHLGLEHYQPERIHGTRMSLEEIDAQCQWFVDSTAAQRAALGFMHPGRVDVIHAGALVWQEIVRKVAAESGVREAITSEHDILDGLAIWAAREPNPPHFAG